MYRPSNGDMTVFQSFYKNLLHNVKHQETLFLLVIWLSMSHYKSNLKSQYFLSRKFQ